MFDQFDRIYIVNLESRPDRRREMQRQMKLVGLDADPRVSYFAAIRTEDRGPFARLGSHGAFLSHLAILRKHLTSGETILILQDDCDFIRGAQTVELGSAWDIFYGGYHQLDPGDLDKSNIQGAHCMGFASRVIPPLAQFLSSVYSGSYRPADEAQAGQGSDFVAPPIDGAIVWFRRAHPEVRTLFEQVSYQRSSRTDIGDLSWVDKLPAVAAASRLLLRIVRRARMRFPASSERA
jgi:glycosyl transferase family 25